MAIQSCKNKYKIWKETKNTKTGTTEYVRLQCHVGSTERTTSQGLGKTYKITARMYNYQNYTSRNFRSNSGHHVHMWVTRWKKSTRKGKLYSMRSTEQRFLRTDMAPKSNINKRKYTRDLLILWVTGVKPNRHWNLHTSRAYPSVTWTDQTVEKDEIELDVCHIWNWRAVRNARHLWSQSLISVTRGPSHDQSAKVGKKRAGTLYRG